MEPPCGLSSAQAAAAASDGEQVVALLVGLAPGRDESVASAFLDVRAALHADAPARLQPGRPREHLHAGSMRS
jgi:hypothetical protein